MSSKDTAVVVLNYNGIALLKKFIEDLVFESFNSYELYIIDNGSCDESVKYIRNNFPTIKIISIEYNVGFARAYNQGLKQINKKYYALLNNDIKVTPGWFSPLYELMEKDDQIAACQPKIKNFSNAGLFEYAGACGGFLDFLGYPFCQGRIFASIEADHKQYNRIKEIFWACGGCFFIRADLFHRYGGFDGDFFAHMEEIDLCWRMKNAGNKIMVNPLSTVYHMGGQTIGYQSFEKTYLNFRNNLTLLIKNLPLKDLYWKLSLRVLLDTIAAIKMLFEKNPQRCFAIFKAQFYILCHFLKFLNKRKNQKIPNKMPHDTYKKSIVISYFILGKKKFSELIF